MMLGVFRFLRKSKEVYPTGKICFRCKVEDPGITAVCLNCKRAIYCNRKCLRKNRKMHDIICNIYIEKSISIRGTFEEMQQNFQQYEIQVTRLNEKKMKEFSYV
jgi:tRNA G18 (ribose-2'-O)-methylase SpoU